MQDVKGMGGGRTLIPQRFTDVKNQGAICDLWGQTLVLQMFLLFPANIGSALNST